MKQHTVNRRSNKISLLQEEIPTPENLVSLSDRSSIALCDKDRRRKRTKRWRTLMFVNSRVCLYLVFTVLVVVHNRVVVKSANSKYLEEQRPTTTMMQQQRQLFHHERQKQNTLTSPMQQPDGRRLMKDAGFLRNRPQIIRFDYNTVPDPGETAAARVDAIDAETMAEIDSRHLKKSQKIDRLWRKTEDYFAKLDDDWRVRSSGRAPGHKKSCKPQHEWQTKSFPTCSSFHEQDIGTLLSSSGSPNNTSTKDDDEKQRARVSYVNRGAFRDVWRVYTDDSFQESVALKTLAYEREFDSENDERHRRDAVANERLTSSRFIAPIFGACGNSALVEFADGGMLQDILKEWTFNSTEKLILGYQAVAAVSDVHNTDHNGRASISHTDVKAKQYVYAAKEGVMKLTDFNRCRFIEWDTKQNRACPFKCGGAGGKYRSPEEYRSDFETEKIDVFQVANVLYTILTGKWPFEDYKQSTTSRYVRNGRFPPIAEEFRNSTDAAEAALLKAMEMSWVYDPEKRAPAMEVKDYLYSVLQKLGAGDKIFFE